MDSGGMAEAGFPASVEEDGGSFLPFLLLVAAVAAVWWFWSNSTGSSPSAGSASTPVPDAEELRRKRLEALQASQAQQAATPKTVAEVPPAGEAVPAKPAKREEAKADAPAKAPPPEDAKAKAPSDGLRKRTPAPEIQKASVPAAPAKDVPASIKENVPPPATPQRFALRARGTLQGASVLRSVDGLEASTTVEKLQAMVHKAFMPAAAGHTLRIFFSGKELKDPSQSLQHLGLTDNACLQVMFVAKPAEPAVVSAAASEKRDAPTSQSLKVRLQSTINGNACAQVVEELTTASTVLDLEGFALSVFDAGKGMKPRLFFMGRELKEGDAFLGHIGLKTSSTATVQVMFAPGDPRAEARKPAAAKVLGSTSSTGPVSPVNPTALAAAAGAAQAETGEAVMAAAEAAGCNVSALLGGPGDAPSGEETPVDPSEAWRAMAGLEEQLARETDFSEDASVRQASTLLRQMLTTAAHDSNPALIQMAQAMVPDLKKIWGFEPTREHLKGLLALKAGSAGSR
mmetsp:Transcript_17914/g.40368  ORF Transcript_17914/g.40368 Transcript_17914/m.40368 type:complete len:515 (-) Transcript_17914:72-1616(-)